MCLAVPSKIVDIDGDTATVDVSGIRREISLILMEDVQVGDYVIVHAGFALHKIDEISAQESLILLQETADLMDGV